VQDVVDPENLETHLRELRRGSVVLACLLVLQTPGYGYGLLERLQAADVDVDANTLYPLLRRLEKQGLLTSEWDTEGPRPRKYYATSREGRDLATRLISSWFEITETLKNLEKGGS
jgi:PadR family transcriptional regulator, regulatory protein PadR